MSTENVNRVSFWIVFPSTRSLADGSVRLADYAGPYASKQIAEEARKGFLKGYTPLLPLLIEERRVLPES